MSPVMSLGMAEDHKKNKLRGFHRDSIHLGKQWYLYHLLLGSNFVITFAGRQLCTAAGWFLESFIRSDIHH